MEEKEWRRKVRTCVQFLFWLHLRHLARSAWYFQLSDDAIGIDKRKREKMRPFFFMKYGHSYNTSNLNVYWFNFLRNHCRNSKRNLAGEEMSKCVWFEDNAGKWQAEYARDLPLCSTHRMIRPNCKTSHISMWYCSTKKEIHDFLMRPWNIKQDHLRI